MNKAGHTMTKIYVIRHAEAEGNLYRRIHGHYDSMITENGLRQIESLRDRFAGEQIDAVYSSDLNRTRQTAGALYPSRDLPLFTKPELREIYLGRWEDQPFGYLEQREKESLTIFNKKPLEWRVEGAETYRQVISRMTGAIKKIAQSRPDQTVAIVSHGCAIRGMLYGLLGYAPDRFCEISHCDNTGVSLLEYHDGEFNVAYQNDNSHLNSGISTLARQNWWREQGGKKDYNIWFAPMGEDRERYIEFRRDAWRHIYGRLDNFDGTGFLQNAMQTTRGDENYLVYAMLGTGICGLLQLNPILYKDENIGYIPFFYLREEYRYSGLGVQLLGHAVSVFRNLGYKAIRLSVAPQNEAAVRFYTKHGFYKISENGRKKEKLYVLEKNISVQ